MPFTLSHPAAVIPIHRLLLRGRLPFAALVAGSVTPDLPYYLTPGKFPYFMHNAHTFPRSFAYCLPAGIIVLLLARLLQGSLRRILPEGLGALSAQWLGAPLFAPPALPFTLLALLLGAWSHIAWDYFTHRTGWAVNYFSFLKAEVAFGFELFRVLQHGSTVLGAAVLYCFLRREAAKLNRPLLWRLHWKWAAWGGAGLAALAFTALTFRADWNYALTANDRRLGFLFVISLVRNSAVAVALTAVALRLARPERTAP